MCQKDPRGHDYQAGKRLLEIIFACTLLTANACSRSPQEPTTPPADHSRAKTEAPVLEQPLPDCPLRPSQKSELLAEPESSSTHHHRVVLTWDASASAKGPKDPTVGYCLYRSRENQITAHDLNRCKNCKRINRRPMVGTACVDNDVQDGHTYFYAAASIRSGSALSSFSNKTRAVIPSNAKSPQAASPYPSCEGENSTPPQPTSQPKH